MRRADVDAARRAGAARASAGHRRASAAAAASWPNGIERLLAGSWTARSRATQVARRRPAEALGGRRDEHHARGGPTRAQGLVLACGCCASRRCSGRRTLGRRRACTTSTRRGIGAELVGDQHGQRAADALPHLGAVADDGDHAVGADLDEGVGRQAKRRWRRRPAASARERVRRHAEREAGGGERPGRRGRRGPIGASIVEGVAHRPPAAAFGRRRGSAGRCRIGSRLPAQRADRCPRRWARVRREQRRGAHDLAGLAEAALRDAELGPRLLQGVIAVGREALDVVTILCPAARRTGVTHARTACRRGARCTRRTGPRRSRTWCR